MRRTAAAQAAEAERRLVTELEAAEHGLARLDADRVQRSADDAGARAEQAALHEERERDAAMVVSLADRLPGLELAEAEARDRRVARDEATRALADQEREVGERRRTVDMSAAQLTERREVLGRRLTEVEDRLARDPERRALAERHRDALEQRGERYTGISERLSTFTHRVDGLLARWRVARREEAERAAVASQQLQQIRRTRADAERELVELREHAQRREVSEAETRLRLETAIESLRTEHDVEPAAALDAPAPEVPEGTTLAGRARDLERDLRLMGPINPLALEEHEALQERHAFLQEQLEDVKATRRELQRVIKAVDREIVTVFETAFADVQEHFAALFTTLFPGGGGKLSLTDPDDLLSTGIEMEARPSGKNVRRLSLLSGGERSLTALAFLFAVFRARPSPFYLMDEVEAALDDVNLHRFLDLVHEFRDEAQLLIVSHQKRTMEAADCLYGVSMPPGGSSRVVSQRVRDEITVS